MMRTTKFMLTVILTVVSCTQLAAQGFQRESFPEGSYSPVTNINRGSYGTGNALELLREAGRERAIRGWSGILLASMEIDFKGRKPLFLEVQYEQDLLNSAADWTDKKLESYFREISR